MRKYSKNILVAFVLNLFFAIFEMCGGLYTGSVAIMSDALHDFGDAVSIGLSYFLERKSQKCPDTSYTYGYARYSVFGSFLTTAILIFGSVVVIYNAVLRLINPIIINYDGMIVIAIIGVIVNTVAAFVTKGGNSMNQKAVNLHMMEDVLGWVVVLIGAIVMKFVDSAYIDSIMSICVSVLMLTKAVPHATKSIQILTDKSVVNVEKVKKELEQIDGIISVHHIHIWSPDGVNSFATMHAVSNANQMEIKKKIRECLEKFKITHSTIELEAKWEHCDDKVCNGVINTNINCPCGNH